MPAVQRKLAPRAPEAVCALAILACTCRWFSSSTTFRGWVAAAHLDVPLATGPNTEELNEFVTGVSSYPVGEGAPFHWHNCDEQVVVLSGTGEVEVDGVITALQQYDGAYVEANKKHRYPAVSSDTEPMVISGSTALLRRSSRGRSPRRA